jgi:hypothetical protein
MLASAKVQPGDPQATPENLLRLFQITQLVLELQHIYVEEDSAKMVEQEQEIKRLEAVAQTVSSGGKSSTNLASNNFTAAGRSLSRIRVTGMSETLTQRLPRSTELRHLEAEIVQLEQRNQYAVRTLQLTEQDLNREKALNQDLSAVCRLCNCIDKEAPQTLRASPGW